MRRSVLPETTLIAAICLADMAWTILVVRSGTARESNPLLAHLIARSTILFAVVKMASFLGPLTALEALRARIPVFVTVSMRAGIIAYLLIYALGSAHASGAL